MREKYSKPYYHWGISSDLILESADLLPDALPGDLFHSGPITQRNNPPIPSNSPDRYKFTQEGFTYESSLECE